MSNGPLLPIDVKSVPVTESARYREELRKTTKEFEGVLLAKMFQAMRSTVPKSELMGGGHEQGIYEDMLFVELTRVSAHAESIGIAEMLFQSFVGPEARIQPENKTNHGESGVVPEKHI